MGRPWSAVACYRLDLAKLASPTRTAVPIFSHLLRDRRSEPEPDSTPSTCGRAGREKGRLLDGKLSIYDRERACDEVARAGESRRTELCSRIVSPIKKIVDSDEHVQPPVQLVTRSQVDNPITRRRSGPKIVGAVGLMQVVFVAPGIGVRDGYQPE